jgi:hypothetical protein
MTTTTTEPPELGTIEEEARLRLEQAAGHVEADLDATVAGADEEEVAPERFPARTALAVALPVAGAGIMVGGIFEGASGRIDGVVAGLLGVALAVWMSRLRRALVVNVGLLIGVFLIGLIVVVPDGLGSVADVRLLASKAAASGRVLRPPVPLDPGWQAIIGWIMGIVGVVVAWTAVVLKRNGLALVISLPIAAAAGISVPKDAQVASGIALLALFATALAILSGEQSTTGDEKLPWQYEVRRTLRGLPVILAITIALFGLSQANFLFPAPVVDPTHKPQKPKAVPLSKVPDRVLFNVESTVSGPWRIGSLDVYDGLDWRLPPYAQNRLAKVPKSGIVDAELKPGVKARFTIAGLTGAVLPGLPNLVGVVASGPGLAYDGRNGNIRVDQGQVQPGLIYTVTAAALPTVEDLRKIDRPLPSGFKEFTNIPPAPAAVQALIKQAPQTSKWDEFDYLRTYVLQNVTVTGTGSPVSVPPDRVQQMLTGAKEGSPFEIVAAQAMLARWVGIPSRIGYGFDGGEEIGNHREVRPKNGSTFVEVYFPTFGWLPVIGTPVKAKATVGGDPNQQQFDPNVLPSDDISVQLYVPLLTPPGGVLFDIVRKVVTYGAMIAIAIALVYIFLPILYKSRRRNLRRRAARIAGNRARVAVAYAEWRDAATDYGFSYHGDTPLMFTRRFIPDPEHRELAWLTTRVLWGDLMDTATARHAAIAEELSRALRRRLAQGQPATIRAVALVSRLSVRNPFLEAHELAHA